MPTQRDAAHPFRALLLALLLAVVGLGSGLLPNRVLLPEDPRIYPPLGTVGTAALDEAGQKSAAAASVPSRRDSILQFLPFDTAVAEAWSQGEAPLWDTRLLCGTPLLAQATSRAFYPTAALFLGFGPGHGRALAFLLHCVLGGLCAYLLARRLQASEGGAQVANASLVLSGYVWAHVQHPMIFFAGVWLLPALLCAERIVDATRSPRSKRLAAIGLALCTALSWFAGFVQAAVFVVEATGLFVAVLAFTRWRKTGHAGWRDAGLALAALVVGVLLAAPQILPTLEMAAHSARRPLDVATMREHSWTLAHLIDFVLPGQMAAPADMVVAGGVRPTWLALLLTPTSALVPLANGVFNHTEVAAGFGIWPLFFSLLALVALFSPKSAARGPRLALALLALLGILFALATPGVLDVLRILPGFDVGSPMRALMLPALLLPVLAGCGFGRLRVEVAIVALIGGFILVALGLALFAAKQESLAERLVQILAWRHGYAFEDVAASFAPGELAQNQVLLARGVLVAGLTLSLGGALGRLRKALPLVFVALTAFELVFVAWSTTPSFDAAALDATLVAPLSDIAAKDGDDIAPRIVRIEEKPGSLAEVTLWPPNLPLRSGFADVLGYAPIPSLRTEAFFSCIDARAATGGAGVPKLTTRQALSNPLLELIGANYAVVDFDQAEAMDWDLVLRDRHARFLERRSKAPRARLYRDHVAVTREEALTALRTDAGAALEKLFVEAPNDAPPATAPSSKGGAAGRNDGDRTDTLSVEAWQNGRIDLSFEVAQPAYAFVAEAWMPGWQATIAYEDGERTTSAALPANLAFCGIQLERAGRGRIELRYAPTSFKIGLALGAAALLMILIGLVAALRAPRPAVAK